VRAAAIEAGIVKVLTQLEQAQRAWQKLDAGDRKAFRKWLEEQP
jgi:hypothetical protein